LLGSRAQKCSREEERNFGFADSMENPTKETY
jgi:hypothetical protein